MKKFISGFLAGSLLLGAISAYATGGNLIEIFYNVNDIKIDGTSIMPREENLKPFVYNGRTFVPLNFITTNLGKKVTWDGSSNTVNIDVDNTKHEDVLSVINKYYDSFREENMDLLKSTLAMDRFNEGYFDYVERYYEGSDFDYALDSVEVLKMDNDEALVRVKETATKLKGPEQYQDSKIDNIYVLQKRDGKWKITDWTAFQ